MPQKPIDEYTLRKFQRGRDVEERVIAWVAPDPSKVQVPVEYRGVVGFADVVMDYPVEVKSCTNLAFKWKQKEGPSRSHRLQAMLYAKALGHEKFRVAYVASDDYRVLCFEEPVTNEVDQVIDAYEAQVKLGTVPVFTAQEKWQALPDYCSYPEWLKLDEAQIAAKVAALTK